LESIQFHYITNYLFFEIIFFFFLHILMDLIMTLKVYIFFLLKA